MRIKLYIMSLWILFLLVIIATLDIPVSLEKNSSFIGIKALCTPNNIISFISFAMLILGGVFYYQFNHRLRGAPDGLPVKIKKLENINYEYVSLFMTLISIIAFDFTTIRGTILFVLVILILGAIFVKTELFYSNPSFALLGFYIYRAETASLMIIPDHSILISRGKLKIDEKIDYIKISETVFYCQKTITNEY